MSATSTPVTERASLSPRDADHPWERQGECRGPDDLPRKHFVCRYCGCTKQHGDSRRIGAPAADEVPLYKARRARLWQSSPPPCLTGAARLQLDLGEKHLQAALDYIQQAQNRLGDALANISPIIGGSRLWHSGNQVHMQIKSFWYATDKTRSKLRTKRGPKVDEINLSAELERRARSGAHRHG